MEMASASTLILKKKAATQCTITMRRSRGELIATSET
jgi:hypothetical protein